MSMFRFCPQCGEPLQRQMLGGVERGVCPAPGCGFIHWDNPTPVVAAVVEHNQGIILARNVLWQPGSFALITGFLEKNEDPAEAVVREVKEELDLDAEEPPGFIGHYPFARMNQLIIAYHVKAAGRIRLNEELAEWRHIPFERVKFWPSATGLALRDWLRSRGYDPQERPHAVRRTEPPPAS